MRIINPKKDQIEQDATADSNQNYLVRYLNQAQEYGYLIHSIEQGEDRFPEEYSGICRLLWNDYCLNLEEYERTIKSAEDKYQYYLNAGSVQEGCEELLAYDRNMLEGYQYYRDSVLNGCDMFADDRDSVCYRPLYTEYQKKYDELAVLDGQYAADAEEIDGQITAKKEQEALVSANQPERMETAACEEWRKETLSSINHIILQLESSIAQKELGTDSAASEYQLETAKTQLESAKTGVIAYQNKTLADYRKIKEDCENKVKELQTTASKTVEKKDLLAELENVRQNAKKQIYYQTVTQIDSTLQALQAELENAKAEKKQYQIANTLYQSGVDQDGVPLKKSMTATETISTMLSRQEELSLRLGELNAKIRQTQEQIAQGTIIAQQSGIISAKAVLVNGDSIAAGTSFASIIPFDGSEYKVQLYAGNADIANIKVGDTVKYDLSALPSRQYGMVRGSVISISADTLVQDGQYSGYYLVEGSMENTELSDKDGNIGNVVLGMQVRARIVTRKTTIMRYLLEKIDLW